MIGKTELTSIIKRLKNDQLFKLWQVYLILNHGNNTTTIIPMINVVPAFKRIANIVGVEWKDDEYFQYPRYADFWKVVDEFMCGLLVSLYKFTAT